MKVRLLWQRRVSVKRCLLCALWVYLGGGGLWGDDRVDVAFSQAVFQGVNVLDLKAAAQVWVEQMSQTYSVGTPGDVQIYQGEAEVDRAIEKELFEVCFLLTDEYVRLTNKEKLDAFMVPQAQGVVGSELVILVNRSKDIQSIGQLKGLSLNLSSSRYQRLEWLWIENLVLAAGDKEGAHHFFSKVAAFDEPFSVVLPVFFGKVDACIIARNRYELMTELNPQVGKQLRPLAISPSFVASLIVLRKEADPEKLHKIRRALSEVHTREDGKQLMMNFKTDQFVPCQPAYIQPVEQLLKEHERLRAALGLGGVRE